MSLLILDAAFPPSPQQWVDDMNAVGADGGLVYVWGSFVNYLASHVSTARASNKLVLPIVVPGNVGPAWHNVEARLTSFGFAAGPVIYDFEPGSEPLNTWWDQQQADMRGSGFWADRYGTTSELGKYDPGAQDWIAEWIRTGTLNPLPALPATRVAWQFVNDIIVNGNQYDASVISPTFATRGNYMTLDPTDGIVQEIRERLNDLDSMLANGTRQGAAFDASGNATYVDEPTWPFWLAAQFAADKEVIAVAVTDLKVAIGNLQVPQATLQPVTDALAKLSAHLGVGTP